MNASELTLFAQEVGNEILSKKSKDTKDLSLSKAEIQEFLPPNLDNRDQYYTIIFDALTCLKFKEAYRFIGNKGPIGGIRRNTEGTANSQNSITNGELKELKKFINSALERIHEPKIKKEEQIIEEAFEKWLNNPENKARMRFKIICFDSSARTGKEGENVDGYAIEIRGYRYHLMFHPILTSFEVKRDLPNVLQGFNKARGYLKFSHHVYLVFKYDGNVDEVKEALKKAGFEENVGVGVYYTQDGVNFLCVYQSNPNGEHKPLPAVVEEHLDRLLKTEDKKNELIKYKLDYMKSKMTSALGS